MGVIRMNQTLIQKRTHKGIWHNLYEFPLIETEKEEGFDYISNAINQDFFKNNPVTSILEPNEKSIIHKLSHQHLHIKFWEIKVKGKVDKGISQEELKTFPFPIVIHNFIEKD